VFHSSQIKDHWDTTLLGGDISYPSVCFLCQTGISLIGRSPGTAGTGSKFDLRFTTSDSCITSLSGTAAIGGGRIGLGEEDGGGGGGGREVEVGGGGGGEVLGGGGGLVTSCLAGNGGGLEGSGTGWGKFCLVGVDSGIKVCIIGAG
jgi:hypothetical protein